MIKYPITPTVAVIEHTTNKTGDSSVPVHTTIGANMWAINK